MSDHLFEYCLRKKISMAIIILQPGNCLGSYAEIHSKL